MSSLMYGSHIVHESIASLWTSSYVRAIGSGDSSVSGVASVARIVVVHRSRQSPTRVSTSAAGSSEIGQTALRMSSLA